MRRILLFILQNTTISSLTMKLVRIVIVIKINVQINCINHTQASGKALRACYIWLVCRLYLTLVFSMLCYVLIGSENELYEIYGIEVYGLNFI